MTRQDVIDKRLAQLASGFARYLTAYDELVPFTSEQLAAHRETIKLRRQAGSVSAAVSNPDFVVSLRRTLVAWRLGIRASKLVPPAEFAQALIAAVPLVESIEDLTIDAHDLPRDIADRLWLAVDGLRVVENKARLVAGTKTLHHLLPDLVVPMDRAWTGKFFQLHLPEWQDQAGQRRILRLACNEFARVARQVNPEQYVTGNRWRTSRTKILDNALIGFCKLELAEGPTAHSDGLERITFEVSGHPPIKNEAKSLLSAGHSQAGQVRSLLAAAQQACREQAFVPIDDGVVALDVVVRTPAPPPGDATNYLGGIGDVLQDKSASSVPLDHLGDLAAVRLYRNDRQIRQVGYREEMSGQAGYKVTVRRLPEHGS